MKTIVFDMDGTLADFYGVNGWLDMIHNEDATPYRIAKPLYDMTLLYDLLMLLKNDGFRIAVTSWLANGSTKDYDKEVRQAKKEWLDKFNFPYDELHIVKYGTTKANCTRKLGGYQILIDDNEQVRDGWTLGTTIDANQNIFRELQKLVS